MPAALLTLFVVATREGWPTIMWSTVYAGEFEDEGPALPEAAQHGWFAIFFVYIIVMSFFLINMFTGILYKQFNAIRVEFETSSFLTREQQTWVGVQRMVRTRAPTAPITG